MQLEGRQLAIFFSNIFQQSLLYDFGYFTMWIILDTQHFNLNAVCKERDLISFSTWFLYNVIFQGVLKWQYMMTGVGEAKTCGTKWWLIITIELRMTICVLFSLNGRVDRLNV